MYVAATGASLQCGPEKFGRHAAVTTAIARNFAVSGYIPPEVVA
jgi:hypothetical protein